MTYITVGLTEDQAHMTIYALHCAQHAEGTQDSEIAFEERIIQKLETNLAKAKTV